MDWLRQLRGVRERLPVLHRAVEAVRPEVAFEDRYVSNGRTTCFSPRGCGTAARGGKQLPWFKICAARKRRGKERDKLAIKLEALAEVCDAESRARLLAILADSTGVTFSSDLLRAL